MESLFLKIVIKSMIESTHAHDDVIKGGFKRDSDFVVLVRRYQQKISKVYSFAISLVPNTRIMIQDY